MFGKSQKQKLDEQMEIEQKRIALAAKKAEAYRKEKELAEMPAIPKRPEPVKLTKEARKIQEKIEETSLKEKLYQKEKELANLPPIAIPPISDIKSAEPIKTKPEKEGKQRHVPVWLKVGIASAVTTAVEWNGIRFLSANSFPWLQPFAAFVVFGLWSVPLVVGSTLIVVGVTQHEQNPGKKRSIALEDFIEQVNEGRVKLDMAGVMEIADAVNGKASIYGKKLVAKLEDLSGLKQASPEGLV